MARNPLYLENVLPQSKSVTAAVVGGCPRQLPGESPQEPEVTYGREAGSGEWKLAEPIQSPLHYFAHPVLGLRRGAAEACAGPTAPVTSLAMRRGPPATRGRKVGAALPGQK